MNKLTSVVYSLRHYGAALLVAGGVIGYCHYDTKQQLEAHASRTEEIITAVNHLNDVQYAFQRENKVVMDLLSSGIDTATATARLQTIEDEIAAYRKQKGY